MKSLSAKRIAAVIGGAALVATSLAVASPITISSMPIISNTGQPVVQIVVGSKAMPSDGVAAANIAAAIGNLAFKTVNVTASVNQSEAQKVLHVVSSSSSSAPSSANAQVYFNSTSSSVASGTYTFSALIGSVLNRAVKLNVPQYTTSLQDNSNYGYPETSGTTTSPVASPYTANGGVPINTTVTATSNGGGASFSSFTLNGNSDNILRVTNSELPSLLSNYGSNGESEYLWLTGFPVYDQQTSPSVQNFALLDAGGAYQAVFSTPIGLNISTNTGNDAHISLMGQQWTIIGANTAGIGAPATTSNVVYGGKLSLAESLTNSTTVYVGENISSGPYKVELTGLGNQNSSGIAQASVAVYYKNSTSPVNVSVVPSEHTTKFNISGTNLFLHIGNTFAGLRSSSEFAQMQLYANVYNVSNGGQFNKTNNPGWYVNLAWTNTTNTAGKVNQLKSIIIYNDTPTNLLPGQSFTFMKDPAMWKMTFIGQTLSSGSYDTVTATTSSTSSETYANTGTGVAHAEVPNNMTEPAQLLTITSGIPNAFSYAGQTNNTVIFDLTPYTFSTGAVNGAGTSNTVWVSTSSATAGAQVSSTRTINIKVVGYTSSSATSPITESVTVNAPITSTVTAYPLSTGLYNVTQIQPNAAIPGMNVVVAESGSVSTNAIGTLASTSGAEILYAQAGKSYLGTSSSTSVLYNQQNSQPSETFSISSPLNPSTTGSSQLFYTFQMNELAVPTNTAATDGLAFGIANTTTGPTTGTLFQLNESFSNTGRNMTYYPSGDAATSSSGFDVGSGFVTQRGSVVGTLSRTSVSVKFAKAVDMLQFAVAPVNSTAVTKVSKQYGPFSVGQAITGVPGVNSSVEIAAIKNVSIVSGQGSIAGISNITATPSQLTADEPVMLSNLPSSPMVVLDNQSITDTNLILIGSGYVNTLSAKLQSAQNISDTSLDVPGGKIETFGNETLIAGWTASQTTAAANSFISDLYAKAASS